MVGIQGIDWRIQTLAIVCLPMKKKRVYVCGVDGGGGGVDG